MDYVYYFLPVCVHIHVHVVQLLARLSLLDQMFLLLTFYSLNRPNAFAVITPSRVFNLISESSAEMHMWIGGIIAMHAHIYIFQLATFKGYFEMPCTRMYKCIACMDWSVMNMLLWLSPALSPRKFSLGEDDLLQTARAKGVVICILYVYLNLTPVILQCILHNVQKYNQNYKYMWGTCMCCHSFSNTLFDCFIITH